MHVHLLREGLEQGEHALPDVDVAEYYNYNPNGKPDNSEIAIGEEELCEVEGAVDEDGQQQGLVPVTG